MKHPNNNSNKTPKSLDKKAFISNKAQTPSSAKHSLIKKSIQFNSDPKPKTSIKSKASLQQFNQPTQITPSSTRVVPIIMVA